MLTQHTLLYPFVPACISPCYIIHVLKDLDTGSINWTDTVWIKFDLNNKLKLILDELFLNAQFEAS